MIVKIIKNCSGIETHMTRADNFYIMRYTVWNNGQYNRVFNG